MTLSKNLLKECEKKELTLTSLTRLSKIKQPTLYGWSIGRGFKKNEDLRKVCEVLEIGLHSLLFEKPDLMK